MHTRINRGPSLSRTQTRALLLVSAVLWNRFGPPTHIQAHTDTRRGSLNGQATLCACIKKRRTCRRFFRARTEHAARKIAHTAGRMDTQTNRTLIRPVSSPVMILISSLPFRSPLSPLSSSHFRGTARVVLVMRSRFPVNVNSTNRQCQEA